VTIAVVTLLALGLRLYQLWRPGYLLSVTEYDDGPYFGSAVRLVNGSIPYRDFLLVQPPGITLLMTPSALLGKLVGTDWAIASGRLLTVVAGTASVTLGGLLARHRGIFAVLVACGLPPSSRTASRPHIRCSSNHGWRCSAWPGRWPYSRATG
jgi:alpha-1,2-mannosyltransferase